MGGGIGMGNTCKPMAVSFQCTTKFTTNKKKKKKKNRPKTWRGIYPARKPVIKASIQTLRGRVETVDRVGSAVGVSMREPGKLPRGRPRQ